MHQDLGYIVVSGEGDDGPSVVQKATFVDVKDAWDRWMEVLEKALDQHQDPTVSERPRDLCPDDIILAEDEMAWSFRFSISGENEFLSLLAEFKEGAVRVKILDRYPDD